MSDSAREIRRSNEFGRSDRSRANGRITTRLGVLDLLLQLWRARLLMFLIFFAFVLAGLATARLFPANAVATASVLVSGPPEVSMTTSGDRSARIVIRPSGASLEVERQAAMSPVFASEAIAKVGADRLYPDPLRFEGETSGAAAGERERVFLSDLSIEHEAGSSVLRFQFAHPNPGTANDALTAYIDAYIAHRNRPTDRAPAPPRAEAMVQIDERLTQANDAILAFLDAHGVGDVARELETVNATLATISNAQVEVRASLSAARGRAGELEEQIEGTAKEVELFVETVTTDRLGALESERARLLARFGPDHPVIGELDGQVALARRSPAASLESGRRRTGLNPLYQALAEERSDARAQIAALTRRAATLADQRGQVETRRRELAALEPQWRALLRARDALETGARLPAGAPSDGVEEAGAGQVVSLLEASQLAGRGLSPAHGIAAIFAALGLVCALAVGLIRGWLSRGLPTPAAAERTLGLRVLATLGDG